MWRAQPLDQSALTAEVTGEISRLGGPRISAGDGVALPRLLGLAISTTRRHLDLGGLVEVGIGCEACHGGSRAHAQQPSLLPSFVPHSPGLRLSLADAPAGRAEWINRTCARCHTVLFSGYPYTWEGGQRRDPVPGGSAINSGEARDYLLGHCWRQMACTACHDPHTRDSRAHLDALAGPAGDAICQRCHTGLKSPAQVAAHTHHRPGSAGSACLACHMARKNLGLEYRLTRYHRIGSPTDRDRVERD